MERIANPKIRVGRVEDARALAELVNYAGEGLPLYLWQKMAGPGESAWAIGQSRAAREVGAFSYRNATVIDHEGGCVACLIGYEIPNTPEPIPADIPPMFRPLQELENLAPATWYVNVLAVSPTFRGHGLGGALLRHAEEIAQSVGKRGLSVIVSDANSGARRLYERQGYQEAAARAMIKNGWSGTGENWILLMKSLTSIDVAPGTKG